MTVCIGRVGRNPFMVEIFPTPSPNPAPGGSPLLPAQPVEDMSRIGTRLCVLWIHPAVPPEKNCCDNWTKKI